MFITLGIATNLKGPFAEMPVKPDKEFCDEP